MLYLKRMRKLLKIFTASLVTGCLSVMTVVCCCVAPVVMAHLHKAAVCSHCPTQDSSHGKPSNPTETCLYHLANAETSHSQTISFFAPVVFTPTIFFDKHITTSFLPSSISAYPRGSPPLAASFVPLYLRTFSLRI